MGIMSNTGRRSLRGLAGLGLVLAAASGCQTQVTGTGMTLPSPRYLTHPPQYIPPSPPFPLARELASQEAIAAAAAPGGVPLPPPVVQPPVGGPPMMAPMPMP